MTMTPKEALDYLYLGQYRCPLNTEAHAVLTAVVDADASVDLQRECDFYTVCRYLEEAGYPDDGDAMTALKALYAAPQQPVVVTREPGVDYAWPPLPRCWSGSPVTITWKEDGGTTTREVYSADQMIQYAQAALTAALQQGKGDE